MVDTKYTNLGKIPNWIFLGKLFCVVISLISYKPFITMKIKWSIPSMFFI